MVEHGLNDDFGVFIALLDTLQNLAHVVCAQMCIESSLASYALEQLFLRVFATKTETDKVGGRQTASTLWRERSFAIQCVVGVDGLAVLMGSDRNASSQMADDEV
jgi:hypothetical protein